MNRRPILPMFVEIQTISKEILESIQHKPKKCMKTQLLAIFMMLCVAGYAQTTLKGRVTDEKDQSLPGVNILIKGTFDSLSVWTASSFLIFGIVMMIRS